MAVVKEVLAMGANQKPPSQRRRYRRREIHIAEPKLRQMTEAERRAGEAAMARLIAAMLVDGKFIKADTKRQRNETD